MSPARGSNVGFGTSRLPSAHTKAVRVLGDGVVTTLAHTDCVTTLDPWASSHSVPPVQAVGGDEELLPCPRCSSGKGSWLVTSSCRTDGSWKRTSQWLPVTTF